MKNRREKKKRELKRQKRKKVQRQRQNFQLRAVTLWPHTSPPSQMILNQRIWLDENIAIRLKHAKHDVNLDHSSFPFVKNSVIEKKR